MYEAGVKSLYVNEDGVMFKSLKRDLRAFKKRDPAARNLWEVAFFYAGFHALLFHRVAHYLWRHGFYFVARGVSWLARFLTQIEIHPAARIGKGLVIDHGSGLVIGETTHIGDDVTLYHGVTLGGIAPATNSKSQVNHKRHPTLKDGVIVGAGAHILGNVTIGDFARVGAGSVVIHDVPASVTVVGVPARAVPQGGKAKDSRFDPYGIVRDGNR